MEVAVTPLLEEALGISPLPMKMATCVTLDALDVPRAVSKKAGLPV